MLPATQKVGSGACVSMSHQLTLRGETLEHFPWWITDSNIHDLQQSSDQSGNQMLLRHL